MIELRAKGIDHTRRAMRDGRKHAVIGLKRALEASMDAVKTEVEDGNWFDAPSGALQTSLWSDTAKRMGDTVTIEGGWGARHGPVLEFGPRVKSWFIRAKYAPYLRFRIGNQIIRTKEVLRIWSEDQLRPHWGPALERKWSALEMLVNQAIDGVM